MMVVPFVMMFVVVLMTLVVVMTLVLLMFVLLSFSRQLLCYLSFIVVNKNKLNEKPTFLVDFVKNMLCV